MHDTKQVNKDLKSKLHELEVENAEDARKIRWCSRCSAPIQSLTLFTQHAGKAQHLCAGD